MLRLDGQDAAARTKAHDQELSDIQAAGLDEDFDTLDSLMEEEDVDAEHFPMSPTIWAQLNESLGGGFRRGEHSMFVVPSGGGKTVMACQILADMASACKNVLFVSTEESLADLWPRVLSSMSCCTSTRIPYQRVKGRPKFRTYLPDTLIKLAESIMNQIKHHMLFADWTGKREAKKNLTPKNYNIDMIDGEIKKASEKFAKQGEKLDIVILDWLGATLQDGIPANEVRYVYAAAAKKMSEVARAYNVATISMVQATGKGSDKAKLDHNDIAECHSLHHLAVACIGISHLKQKDTGEGSAAMEAFKDHQCFNVSKSRFGKPMTFWMRANFDFMRFDLPTSTN
jgi:replicative DNA helicase